MKSLFLVTAALLMTAVAQAQDLEVPNSVEGPGVLEITVEFEGETNTFDAPNKATSELRKARVKTNRVKDGEDTGFRGVVNLNGSSYEFDRPEQVQELLKAVQEVQVLAKKAKIQWGEIGSFPEIPKPNPFNANDPNQKPTRQQAIAIVQQRIQMAIQQEMIRTRRPVYPQRVQQIQIEEYRKAVEAGWLEAPQQPAPGQPVEPPDPKPGQIQYLRTMLMEPLSNGTLIEDKTPMKQE